MRKLALLFFFSLAWAQTGKTAEPKHTLKDLPTEDEKPLASAQPSTPENISTADNAKAADQIAEEFYQLGLKSFNEGRLDQAEGYFDRTLILKPDHQGAKQGIESIMKRVDESGDSGEDVKSNVRLIDSLWSKLEKELNDGELEEAESTATQILAINPDHAGARKKLAVINRKLYNQALQRSSDRELAGDFQGAIDALQAALGYWKDPTLRTRILALRTKLQAQNIKNSDDLYVQALAAHQDGKIDEALRLSKRALELNPNNFQAKRMLDRLQPKPAP